MQTVLKNHTFVGARRYDYDFKGDQGQVTGTAYYVALVEEDPLGFPVEVKVSQAEHDRFVGSGFGAMFDVACEIRAKNNKVQYICESINDSVADIRAAG